MGQAHFAHRGRSVAFDKNVKSTGVNRQDGSILPLRRGTVLLITRNPFLPYERLLDFSMVSPHGICLRYDPRLIWLHVVRR